jgi:hypothetical protein
MLRRSMPLAKAEGRTASENRQLTYVTGKEGGSMPDGSNLSRIRENPSVVGRVLHPNGTKLSALTYLALSVGPTFSRTFQASQSG